MSHGLDLVQSIFSSLSALTLTMLTCRELITAGHQDLSHPVQASFSQSGEVFYSSNITIILFISQKLFIHTLSLLEKHIHQHMKQFLLRANTLI